MVDSVPPAGVFADLMRHNSSGGTALERSTSDQSTGSILYGKAPNPALLAKTASLIFPTGVEASSGDCSGSSVVFPTASGGGGYQHSNSTGSMSHESSDAKLRKINLLLDQCESVRFPFKKKLMLCNLDITTFDIPLNYLCGTPLGKTLHKLSLSGNPLGSIPDMLVQSLPSLQHLDLSQCRLHSLPKEWNLPQLKKLVLSNNSLRDFPEEVSKNGPVVARFITPVLLTPCLNKRL